jgi:hypothetical protein
MNTENETYHRRETQAKQIDEVKGVFGRANTAYIHLEDSASGPFLSPVNIIRNGTWPMR